MTGEASSTAVFDRSAKPPRPRDVYGGASADAVRRMMAAARVASLLVVAIGAIVLLGWAFDLERVQRLHPALVSMKANTALGLVLLGVGLRLQRDGAGHPVGRFLPATSSAVIAIGALTLFEYVTGWSLHIDQAIFVDAGSPTFPGRMSPLSAINFVLLGSALWIEDARPGSRLVDGLALAVALSCLLTLLGMGYGARPLYAAGLFTSVAPHTAAAFALAAMSILFARPDKGLMRWVAADGPGGVLARRMLPASVLFPAAIGFLRLYGQRTGIYGPQVGLVLFASATIVCFSALTLWNSAVLFHSEAARRQAEAAVRDREAALLKAHEVEAHLGAEARKAEATLRHIEDQLRQAQKMDAIGRLAGGVAHDFNNVLSVILSYSDLVLREIKEGDPIRQDVEEIRKAGQRAADLTQQLLLFSRQQIVEPRVMNLNEVLRGIEKMLRRIVGEDVDLVIQTAAKGSVRADPGSIEQVIMNLVVNARDAMPRGGKLTIETANAVLGEDYAGQHLGVSPGLHLLLAVSDTGVGMDRATQAHIFEPFFTTKPTGKGTGLGLATVFGIVQQCRGSIWVYSEVGKGTTFKIYLPVVDAAVENEDLKIAPATLRGSETILLVEDEEQVRVVAQGILTRQGYRVIPALTPADALRILEAQGPAIDLLLTDVVMPQMSGPELAGRAAALRPAMKILCMSGYTDDAVIRHGALEAGISFVQKPFTPDSLARKVREVLDADA